MLTVFAVYFIVWWLTLFLVLPYGVRSQAEEGTVARGTDPGAPVRTHLGIKLVANTVLAAAVTALLFGLSSVFDIGLGDLPRLIMPERP